jgi:type VI protein secretion system component Hcp
MNLLRRLGCDKAPTKDATSRTRRIRARRYVGRLEPLEERQLLAAAFLVIGDGTVVPGGAIRVLSASWGTGRNIIVNPNNPPPHVPPPKVVTFTITKYMDSATPALFKASLSGEPFKSAELVITTVPSNGKILEFDFANVVVKSQTFSSNAKGPVESDTFAFSSVQAKYETLTSSPVYSAILTVLPRPRPVSRTAGPR